MRSISYLVASTILGLLCPAVSAVASDDLVLKLSFEGDAQDTSGLGNHGSIHGATFVAGAFGQALQFDGASNYVRVLTSDSLQTPAFTLSLWARADDAQAEVPRGLLGKHTEHDNITYYWMYQHGGDWTVSMNGDSYGDFVLATNAIGSGFNQWNHLAATYDGLVLRLFVNGVEVSCKAVSGYSGNWHDLLVGAGEFSWDAGRPQRFWKGALDEVCIYSRALGSNEIVVLAAGQTNTVPTPGAIRCDLNPPGARDAGAMWRISIEPTGMWHMSGESSAGLPPGTYELQFTEAPGWLTPPSKFVTLAAGTTQSVVVSYAQEPLDGLVLHYNFENITNGYVTDLSGLANSGRVFGAVALGGGVAGAYASFDGSNDYIQVPHSASLRSTNFTAAVWVFGEDTLPAVERGIIGKHRAFDNISYYWLYQGDTNFYGSMVGGSYGNFKNVAYPSASGIYQWSHLALVYRGTTMSLFVNGVPVSTQTIEGFTGNAYDLLVGAGEWDSSLRPQRWWKGGLDEVRLYNRGLSADEVQALYAGQTNLPVVRGSVRVNIQPDGAASSGAWRLATEADGVWHASGVVVSNLLAGIYPIVFREAQGWSVPAPLNAVVAGNNLTVVTGVYSYLSTNDLVLYFDFDEAPVQGFVPDKSGYGNHGRATNVVFAANGYRAGSFFFNGSNAFAVIPDDNSYDKTSFSISVWSKSMTTNPPANCGIVGKHREGVNSSYYWILQGAAVHFGYNRLEATMNGSQSGEFHIIHTPWEPDFQTWAHCVLTYDQPAMKFYVNGSLISTQNVVGYSGNGYDLLVGAGEWMWSNANVPQRFWNGYLDEVRIYRRALSGEEISNLYSSDVPTDVQAPVITDIQPPNRHITPGRSVTMQITAEDNVGVVNVSVNDQPAEARANNRWRYHQENLVYGSNLFVVVARDEQGNAVTQVVSYIRGHRLRLKAVSDGNWRVENPNDYAINYEWEVLSATEIGTGSVAAADSASFRTSAGPKAVQLTADGYLHDISSWNPEPELSRAVIDGAPAPFRRAFGLDGAGYRDVMAWEGVDGQTYQVQFTSDVNTNSWSDVPDGYYLGDGQIIYHTNVVTDLPAFYRIRVGNVRW